MTCLRAARAARCAVSHDPYLDVDQYEMDAAPRRSSRLYPQDDDTDFYAADPRRNSSGQRWKRYSDRGAF